MRNPLILRFAWLSIALGLVGALAPGVRADEAASERIQRILDYGGFQRELPGAPELPDVAAPPSEPMDPSQTNARDVQAPTDTSLVSALLWTMGVAAVALLVFLLVSRLRIPQTQETADELLADPDAAGSTPRVVDRMMADADRLAAEGAWAEAIHILLLRGLDELRRGAGVSLPPALTSRELLRRIALPEQPASALAAMVAVVERCHFGNKPVGAGDYDTCRAHYRALLDHTQGVTQ